MLLVYNIKPPALKYVSTWDPSVVLSYFDSTAGASLSILQLARRTATLLALTSLSRCADLASIQLPSIHFSEENVSVSLSRPRKAAPHFVRRSLASELGNLPKRFPKFIH